MPTGINFYAKRLAEAILNESIGYISMELGIDVSILSTELADNLRKFPVRTWNKFVKTVSESRQSSVETTEELIKQVLLDVSEQSFARLLYVNGLPWFNVFGCPFSSDIDVVFNVTNSQLPIHPNDFRIAVKTLLQLKYNPKRGFDINFVSFVNDSLQTSSGGETTWILYHTYGYHTQHCPPIVSDIKMLPEHDPFEKSRAFRNFILKELEKLIGKEEYTTIRNYRGRNVSFKDVKTESFHMGFACYELAYDVIDLISRDPTSDRWSASFWKTFALKLTQSILLDIDQYDGRNVYHKKLLVAHFAQSYPEFEIPLRQLLFREVKTPEDFPHEFVNFLKEQFIRIAKDSYQTITNGEAMNVDALSLCSTPLQMAFVSNPEMKPSDEFIRIWTELYGSDVNDGSFQNKFVSSNINVELLDNFPNLRERVLNMPQGTPEWIKAYNTYQCGRNSGHRQVSENATLSEYLMVRYNLIMGMFGERLVQELLTKLTTTPNPDWATGAEFYRILSNVTLVTVGMIISADGRGSCPDGLLVRNDEIIPVEIKTLNCEPIDNSAVRREFSLASKQLTQCVELLNESSPTRIATRGLMLFLFCHNGIFSLRSTILQL
ncbi:MAG: hypothetical protein EB127_15310 [Alphaproteobacteria bacterium]|nr:hypothetical protein [Alphaproteobacteria bacterium]